MDASRLYSKIGARKEGGEMAVLRAGTSGYSFKEWKGSFYPADLPDRQMLPYYANHLPAVEINYTFRHMPTPKTLSGWDAATPPGFVFVLKASQRITHFQKLRRVGESVDYFCSTAALLGPKLGPILFQLPPLFKKDAGVLAEFLDLLPSAHRYAFEFRHPSWFDDEILGHLERRQMSLCINETEEGAPTLSVTAPYLYVRLRRESYDAAAIAAWGARLAEILAGGTDVYAFFKHEQEGPRFATALIAAVSGEGTSLTPERAPISAGGSAAPLAGETEEA
jgi:uncharacterized protein YecE (DUF72 family)